MFSRAATDPKAQKVDESWRESLYRVYRSGQQNMRVAVYGAKHDAAMFETLLQDICVFEGTGTAGNAMVDTAVLGVPKVGVCVCVCVCACACACACVCVCVCVCLCVCVCVCVCMCACAEECSFPCTAVANAIPQVFPQL